VAKTRDEIRELSLAAVARTELIEVDRGLEPGGDPERGFAMAAGQDWILLHVVDPDLWLLDGHFALRLKDIKKLRPYRSKGKGNYPIRALRHFGEDTPRPVVGIDLSSTKRLIVTASECFPIIGIGCERSHPLSLWFGTPLTIKDGALTLLNIDPDASWDETPSRHRLSDITCVQFGNRYEEALSALGGPPPTSR